jgi:hypothetical protein
MNSLSRKLKSVLCEVCRTIILFFVYFVFEILSVGQARSRNPRLTAVGIRCADHVTPSTRKGWQ